MLIVFVTLAVLVSIAVEIAAAHFADNYEIEWRPLVSHSASATKMNGR